MNIDKLFSQINIVLSEKNKSDLSLFYEMLVKENEVMNLTAITDKDEVYIKHFYDSLTINQVLDLKQNITLCDVGGGAGFPSIPLKIIYPNLKITIIDSLGKRINFLNRVIKELGLSDIYAIHTRAEEHVKQYRNYYDIVTARAVARLNILLEICIPLVKKNGLFIALKGNNALEEINEAKYALHQLNCQLINTHLLNLPIENSERNILTFHNKDKTNNQYPREYAKIKKKPL